MGQWPTPLSFGLPWLVAAGSGHYSPRRLRSLATGITDSLLPLSWRNVDFAPPSGAFAADFLVTAKASGSGEVSPCQIDGRNRYIIPLFLLGPVPRIGAKVAERELGKSGCEASIQPYPHRTSSRDFRGMPERMRRAGLLRSHRPCDANTLMVAPGITPAESGTCRLFTSPTPCPEPPPFVAPSPCR